MPEFFGCYGPTRRNGYSYGPLPPSEKKIKGIFTKDSLSDLPCGHYLGCLLTCSVCDGTGIGEEVSGGHKKECESCFGSGIDPLFLKDFNYLNEEGSYSRPFLLLPRMTDEERPLGRCCRRIEKHYPGLWLSLVSERESERSTSHLEVSDDWA